jgi:toxin ParE1/3/4
VTKYHLTRAAADDLTAIYLEGLSLFGMAQADKYHDGLTATFEFLAEYPHAARQREEISPPVRTHRYKSHMVVYELDHDDLVLILRVRHGREDWASSSYDS